MSVYIKTAEGWRPFYKPCVNSNQLEGVFRNITPEQARAEAQRRVDAFCKVVETGSIRDIKNFNAVPLYGAFGERL